jgi:hypothetical protein
MLSPKAAAKNLEGEINLHLGIVRPAAIRVCPPRGFAVSGANLRRSGILRHPQHFVAVELSPGSFSHNLDVLSVMRTRY